MTPLTDAPEGPLLLTEEPQPLRSLRFAVVDLETTGGSPKAFWDRKERFWKNIVNTVLVCACSSPGGGRRGDYGIELSPTKWEGIQEVNVHDPRLKWYRYDENRESVDIPLDNL